MGKNKYNYGFRHYENYKGHAIDIKAKTKKELNVKVNSKKNKIDNTNYNETNTTVSEWLDFWLENIKREEVSTHKSYITYRTQVRKIVNEIGRMQVRHVKPLNCQQMLNTMSGHAKSYIKKTKDTMYQSFEVAARNGMIMSNPAAHLKFPKFAPKKQRIILTDRLRRVVLEVAKTHYAGAWVKVMLLCGARPSETEGVIGKDINIEGRILHLRGSKTEKADRYVPIPESLVQDLTGILPDNFLFTTSRGNCLNAQSRERWWHSFTRECHIYMGGKLYRNQIIDHMWPKEVTPYCLRHTYASDLIAANLELSSVRDLMGHTNINTTNIYIHSQDGFLGRAKTAMDEYHASKLLS